MTLSYLHRMHTPETYPASAAERSPDVLATWLRYAPDAQPVERDWEDWFENAVMLHEADRHAPGNVRILGRGPRYHVLGDATPLVPPRPDMPNAFMFGVFTGSDRNEFPADVHLVGNNADSVAKVMDYARSPTFLAAAGRQFFVCDATEESLNHAMSEIHATGARKAFVKTRFKEAATILTLPETTDRLWWNAAMDTDFEWYLISHEDAKGMLYVQEVFEPTKEYRTIIVGDEVVTGAGCIELFTPLEGRGEFFDSRVEPVRNRSEVVEDPETVARYRAFAEQYAKDWAAENGADHAYSLDLAIDARTGNVVAIEMNPFTNLGLYANDAARIVDAFAARFG